MKRMPSTNGRIFTSAALHRALSSPCELLTLAALPCGCVVADYRVPTLTIDLIALEAKGPHCKVLEHRTGHILGLDEPLGLGAVEE